VYYGTTRLPVIWREPGGDDALAVRQDNLLRDRLFNDKGVLEILG